MPKLRSIVVAAIAVSLLMVSTSAKAQCVASRMMIVLDHSSSMNNMMGAQSQWAAAVDAVTAVANNYGAKIELGLNVFPSPSQCSPGVTVVSPAINQGAAIIGALPGAPPAGGNYTPMSQSIDAAAAAPELADPTHRPSILLVTDGWQWCDPYDAATRTWPIEAVRRAAADGIKVYVVGFGGSVDVSTLNKMAVEGGSAPLGCDPTGTQLTSPNKCYYQTDSPAQLNAALDAISLIVSAEICDGIDNDCDGQVDEGLERACANACGNGQETCVTGAWQSCSAPEPASEVCDGVDNDCDGTVDEGCSCTPGEKRDCGSGVGACKLGTQTCQSDGTWSECAGARLRRPEVCDSLDNDCDGTVDNGSATDLCPGGGTCIDGICNIDGEPDPTSTGLGKGASPGGGCGCGVGRADGDESGARGGSWALLLVLGGGTFVVARRRRGALRR